MSTPPRVNRVELSRAIVHIARRREEVDDRNREMLPDSPAGDPREVLDYLRRYSGPDIPIWVRQADVCDALTINTWLWWEDRRRELHFLEAGVERGMFLAQLGSQIGVGKQGVRDRIDRLRALLRYDRPDEKIMRRERRLRRTAGDGPAERSAEDVWLLANRSDLSDVIEALVDQADEHGITGVDREWLDELVVDVQEGRATPATMVMLGLASADLRTSRPVLALPSSRPCKIHEVLGRADALRASFAAVGPRTR